MMYDEFSDRMRSQEEDWLGANSGNLSRGGPRDYM
jgi:hypothetical protein